MEKVVLSKGYEFEIVPNGVGRRGDKDEVSFTVIPGEYSVEQMLSIWEGNSTIKVKIDETDIRVFNNYMKCIRVSVDPNYLLKTKYQCPECKTEVEPSATTCPNCNAAFEAPEMVEVRGKVCIVSVAVPNINDRMNNAEDAIEDIIDVILG